MASSRLAKAIVQMAESRDEVVRKQIESENVDYYIEVVRGSLGGGWHINSSDSIFVHTGDGIVVKNLLSILEELREKRIVNDQHIFRSAASAFNALSLYGYVPSCSSGFTTVYTADPCEPSTWPNSQSQHFTLRLRVPRKLLKAHPRVLEFPAQPRIRILS